MASSRSIRRIDPSQTCGARRRRKALLPPSLSPRRAAEAEAVLAAEGDIGADLPAQGRLAQAELQVAIGIGRVAELQAEAASQIDLVQPDRQPAVPVGDLAVGIGAGPELVVLPFERQAVIDRGPDRHAGTAVVDRRRQAGIAVQPQAIGRLGPGQHVVRSHRQQPQPHGPAEHPAELGIRLGGAVGARHPGQRQGTQVRDRIVAVIGRAHRPRMS